MRCALFFLVISISAQLATAAEPSPSGPAAKPASQTSLEQDRQQSVARWALAHDGLVRVLVGKVLREVKGLQNLPSEPFTIQEIELRRMTLEPSDLAPVAELKTLPRLIISDAVIGRRGIEALADGCPALKVFVFRQSCVDDEALRPIARLKTLETLALENCAVTDAVLETVAQLTRLRSLNLAGTQVSDAALGKLAKMAQLDVLDLRNTALGAAGFEFLSSLQKLRILRLQGTAADDAGAGQLGQISSLKELNIERTKVSRAAVDALGKKLPNCKISWKPSEQPSRPLAPQRPLPKAVASPAHVHVAGTRGFVPVGIQSYSKPPLLEFLKGATIFAPQPLGAPPNESQGRVGVEIEQDTGLLLAVQWETLPNTQAAWISECIRDDGTRKLGWMGVGNVAFNDPALGYRFLYWRACKRGELLRLRSGRTSPPLVIVPASATANPLDDGPDPGLTPYVAAWVMSNQINDMLRNGRYDELEATIAKIRREKKHFSNGNSYLSLFYNGVTSQRTSDNEYKQQQATLEAWLKAKPRSIAAHLALVNHWLAYAWQARGYGWATSVTPEHWETFGQRLAVARDWIQRAWKLDERDAYLCFDEVTLLTAAGPDSGRVEELVKKSHEIDPTYRGTILNAARYYLPRWHGNQGDLEQFALRAVELTRKEWGAVLYAQIVWDTKVAHGYAVFEDFDFSWDLVKQGYEQQRVRFPQSDEAMGNLSVLAHIKGDRKTAREARSKLAPGDLAGFGRQQNLDMFRRWLADDFAAGDQAALYETTHACMLQLLWLDEGKQWATFDMTPECQIWDAHSGQPVRRGSITGLVRDACLDLGGKFAVLTNTEGELYRYNFDQNASYRIGRHEMLRAVALAPDGLSFVTSGSDRQIRFWDLETGNVKTTWNTGPSIVTSADFLPDGKTLIAGTHDKQAIIWSTADQAKLGELAPLPAEVSLLRVSPDGKLAVCLSGKELSVWDVAGRKRLGLLENPAGQINDLVFSPNGEMLAAPTGTRLPVANGDLLVWDVAARKLLHRFHGHKAAANAVRFAPDGKTMASCSDDGSLRTWKLDAR